MNFISQFYRLGGDGGGCVYEAQVQVLGAAAPAVAPLPGCPVAHLVPVELFTRRFRSVMCPLRRHPCSGTRRIGWDGDGKWAKDT